MRQPQRDEIVEALTISRKAFLATGAFSFVLNILMLASPIYMMQVYDRVMASRSIPTLVALTIMIIACYALNGVLELFRARIMSRIALAFDKNAAERVFDASARLGLVKGRTMIQPLRDFDALRQFLGSPGPCTFFDLPWAPIYLALLFVFHWSLGLFALICAVFLFSLALATEWATHAGVAESTTTARKAGELAEAGHNNAEVLASMGMLGNYRARWVDANRRSLLVQTSSSDTVALLSTVSKTFRMLVQSIILGLGAALAIHGDISAGAIIAGSILMGRALAPVEQVIGHWRGFVRARQAHKSLSELLRALPPTTDKVELPEPKGQLDVRGIRVAPPGTQRVTVNSVSFAVGPGQVLAIAGPSASGKSTLSRALVGVWQPLSGEIRLDGARLDQWDQQRLGAHIGYVPQDVELFAGTVRENIARFVPDAKDADVIAAAQLARAHGMILDLPQGYDTELGSFGSHLSAGQKQRIALARALYGDPVMLVFDEPNSNLDSDGDAALIEAIGDLKARNKTVIIVTHRSSAIARADLLLVMEHGQVRAFGPREEVIRKLNASAAQPQGPSGAPPSPPPGGHPSQSGPQPQPRPSSGAPLVAVPMPPRPAAGPGPGPSPGPDAAPPQAPAAASAAAGQPVPPRPAAAVAAAGGQLRPPPLPMSAAAAARPAHAAEPAAGAQPAMAPPPLPPAAAASGTDARRPLPPQAASTSGRPPLLAAGGGAQAPALPTTKS